MDGARVYNNANINIDHNSLTALTFNSERYDNGNLHSTVSNTGRLTVQKKGIYIITGHIRWTGNASGIRNLRIKLDGTTEIASHTNEPDAATDSWDMSIATIYELDVGQYLELLVFQNSGVNPLVLLNAGNKSPEFAMQLVTETT